MIEGAHARAALASIQDGVLILDRDDRVETVNDAFCEMTGFRRDDVLGLRPAFPWWVPEQREQCCEAHHVVKHEGRGEFDHVYMRESGTRFPVIVTGSAIRDHDGELLGSMALVKEATRLRRRESELQARAEGFRMLAEEQADLHVAQAAAAHQQSALCHIATAVAHEPDLRRVFDLIADEASRLLGGVAASVLRLDADDRYELVGSSGAVELEHGQYATAVPGGAIRVIRRGGRPARSRSPRSGWSGEREHRVGVPIWSEGRLWGVVMVAASEELRAQAELHIAPFADLATLAISSAAARGRIAQLARTQALGAMRVLARAIDAKDPSTQQHSERVAQVATRLATALRWDSDRIEALREASLIHDVGKIGVPDAILLKPDRLTEDEFEAVKRHAQLSAAIASEVLGEDQVGWVEHHHERFGGGGYPYGIAGSRIPAGARVLAVADAWDVMTSARPYSAPMPVAAALAECRAKAGEQFDPDVVDALGALWRA